MFLQVKVSLFAILISALSFASPFSKEEIFSREFIQIKNREWKACHQESHRFAFSLMRDRVAPFVESDHLLRKLSDMEDQDLMQGRADVQPWSGDYWPYSAGLIAVRSFDPDFRQLSEWKERYDYIQDHPLQEVVKKNSTESSNILSPAEKYDLLLGHLSAPLTQSMWSQGKVYFDQSGNVEGWMGICHGWAPAAIMEGRPLKTIEVPSRYQDLKVSFLPAEVKGLISYSWATNPYPAVTLGQRCNEKNPPQDASGRLQNPECFDLNPATWHLAIVNRLGARKKSFIMDATYDYQVWNQPVLEYNYRYFNPKTLKESDSWQQAQVDLQSWSEDPYKSYRSSKARTIVGIEMKVEYVIETDVYNSNEDSEEDDLTNWVTYRYDLELDSDQNIQGGEWYQVEHPDFVWTPIENAEPTSTVDRQFIGSWDAENMISNDWQKKAAGASSKGVIVNRIVQTILKKSQSAQ
jgi:hypothetical protein